MDLSNQARAGLLTARLAGSSPCLTLFLSWLLNILQNRALSGLNFHKSQSTESPVKILQPLVPSLSFWPEIQEPRESDSRNQNRLFSIKCQRSDSGQTHIERSPLQMDRTSVEIRRKNLITARSQPCAPQGTHSLHSQGYKIVSFGQWTATVREKGDAPLHSPLEKVICLFVYLFEGYVNLHLQRKLCPLSWNSFLTEDQEIKNIFLFCWGITEKGIQKQCNRLK